MRIKFNFDDIQCHLESFIPKAWFLLEPDDVQTVADLAKELANKFRLKCNSDCLQLTLDGCLLPHWESTRILRDDDTIRVHLVENVCQRNHKKKKRHRSNDNEHASSAPGTAEPALCDSEISSPLAGIDHLQQHDLKVKRRKKPKSHSHNDGHSLADMFSSDISLQHNEGNTARCYKEATNDDLLNLPQNVETFSAIESGTDIAMVHRPPSDLVEVQATDMSVNNPEHPMQPQTTLLADESVNNSSTAASLSPTESRVNDSSLVSDEQQVKLSHSAKRRRRRHRGRKLDHRNDEANVVKDEQDKNISTAVGSSLHNICASNFPAQVDHSSGVGRTHIIYDNVNSDEESDTKANAATHLNPDSCDVGSVKDQGVDYNTAVADGVVSNSFDTEIASQLQHENTVSGGFASSVKQASSATHIPHEPKMRRPAKNAQFANVQVYCRQRIKKSSATFMPCDQTADTVISPLPEQENADKQVLSAVKDYSQYCCLQGTPRVGDLIAYKIVEMTNDYSPALSQYKEATVTEFNPSTNMVVLHSTADSSCRRTPGRFDISIEYEGEILTNVYENTETCVPWTALHDVRLLNQ